MKHDGYQRVAIFGGRTSLASGNARTRAGNGRKDRRRTCKSGRWREDPDGTEEKGGTGEEDEKEKEDKPDEEMKQEEKEGASRNGDGPASDQPQAKMPNIDKETRHDGVKSALTLE